MVSVLGCLSLPSWQAKRKLLQMQAMSNLIVKRMNKNKDQLVS